MWEMLESVVAWFKYKKWPLPFWIVAVVIVLMFALSFYGEQKSQKPLVAPTTKVSESITPSPTPSSAPTSVPVIKATPSPVREREQVLEEITLQPTTSNISHAKDATIDALKIEGIDSEVATQIFTHLRSQISKPDQEAGTLEMSVRHVLGPDTSEEEVTRITNIMSKAFEDSFNYVQSR